MHIGLMLNNDREDKPVCPRKLEGNVYNGLVWRLGTELAESIIGNTVSFHRKQDKPAFHGGVVVAVVPVESKGTGWFEVHYELDPNLKGHRIEKGFWARQIARVG